MPHFKFLGLVIVDFVEVLFIGTKDISGTQYLGLDLSL